MDPIKRIEKAAMRVRSQRGFGALEYIMVGAVIVSAIVMGMRWWGTYADGRDDAITAGQLQQAMKGAKTWLDNNSGSVTTSQTIPWSTLAQSMPAGLSSTNNWGQTYQLSINVSGSAVNAMLETIGGTAIPENRMRSISQAAGTAGGYVTKSAPTVATGTNGGWSAVLANYGTNPTTVGHLAGSLFYQTAAATNGTYLWRTAVTGQPQLNQMQTAIDMNSNNINNAGTVNAQRVVTAGGNGVQIGSGYLYCDTANCAVRQNGALYIQNVAGTAAADVNAGSVNASGNVNASGSVSASGNVIANGAVQGGFVYSTGSAQVNGNIAVYGQNYGQTVVSNGRLTTNEYLQVNGWAAAGNGCAPNGLIGNSGSGPLFCQSGVWKAAGSSTNNYVSIDVGNGGVFGVPANTTRVDGYVQVTWTGSNAGVAQFIVRDTSGNVQNNFFAGDYGWNDGGSGSQWWFPVSIPVVANTGSIQMVQIDGTNSLIWHIANYQQ
ncbi:shufflon system plasmid conjugative transfer pilus tip adhesin PilV [Burkholderia pseudomallei]|uniref:shufflon system plasmid conjugative transfer pilus tip adhesin PilV n=1 Tax=Burkholderia pseudomallei TaxID=28450 RepID=UPI0018DEB223|nr:shufflon system plasmid conjugative transfer pilus tip adhesin PilV [Burkholderia pseudomallei]